jgi:peptide-methionine (S)-S-oxide reductase
MFDKLPIMSSVAFGAAAALIAAATFSVSAERAVELPPPVTQAPQTSAVSETIVLAGGSFWGVQAVFQHVEGVQRAVAGYAGGDVANPSYKQVSAGETGHAEVVEVTFDPRKIGLGEILRIFFSVAHDPTQLNRQGPDEGAQYRSEIFVADAADARFTKAYIAQLDAAKAYARPIVTKVEPLAAFYPAEGYHQNYATLHPGELYVAYNERPKIENLKRLFPGDYKEAPTLAAQP